MSYVVTVVIWFAFCVYAAILVARRIKLLRDRIAYYLLILLVPLVGAAAAIVLSRRPESKSHASSSEMMQDAIVDAHRQKDTA